jgi:hypothetical protein
MRTTPTLSASGNFAVLSGSSVVSTTSVTLNGSGSDSSFASFLFDVSSGLTTGYGAVLIANNDTTATIKLDAEI